MAPKNGENDRYMILRPDRTRISKFLMSLVTGDAHFLNFLETTESKRGASRPGWLEEAFSFICLVIIPVFGKPLEFTGYVLEYVLNLLSHNDGIFGLIHNIIVHGKMKFPRRGSGDFISCVGYLDGRTELYKVQNLMEQIADCVSKDTAGTSQALLDLCIMASKLAYENCKVIRRNVEDIWKMHYVRFYNGWNDYLQKWATQVFIFCDKAEDANLIVISFRGTEPFNADEWSTNFDVSWYDISHTGSRHLHVGFLEALGLGNRIDRNFKDNIRRTKESTKNNSDQMLMEECERDETFDRDMVIKWSAYYRVKNKLQILLKKHPNAKFVVTGHSLGGALAIMFPTILVLNNETDVMKRLLAVYTFGQPRIGNHNLAEFMEQQLKQKYFRIVHCNDMVPRLPLDDNVFHCKHFGVCLYYDSGYCWQELAHDVPNPNYIAILEVIRRYLNAVWELIRSLTIHFRHGKEYKESWFRTLFRLIGLLSPGLSAHCPTDYINSIRLGKQKRMNNVCPRKLHVS